MRRVYNLIRTVQPGDHIVLFYETLDFKHKVLFTCLKSELESIVTTLYISHKEPATQILRGMKSFGIEVERYARSGLLELWEITPDLEPTEVPLSDQPPFDRPEAFALLKSYLEGKITKKRMTVVADDPLHNMKLETVVNFEKFHSLSLKHTPISLICTYAINDVSREGKLFLDLIKTHRHIIIQTYGTAISLEDKHECG